MRSSATSAYHVLGLVMAIGIVVQVFLAGLGIFGAESFSAHEGFGWILHTLAIVVFVLAAVGPRSGRTIGWAAGLFVLLTLQITMVGLRDDAPGLAALHPVLALFALAVALWIGGPLLSRRRAASAPR